MVLTAEQRERMRISKERALAKRAERRETIAAQQRLQQQQHERPRIQQHQPQQQRRTTQTRGQPTSTTTAASPAYCPAAPPLGPGSTTQVVAHGVSHPRASPRPVAVPCPPIPTPQANTKTTLTAEQMDRMKKSRERALAKKAAKVRQQQPPQNQ